MDEYLHSSLHEIRTDEVEELNFDVLHPENPLMIRFQNALSQMLENKLNTLREDFAQVENELRKKRLEKEDICETLYNQKSELFKLENLVSSHNDSILNIVEKRESLKTDLTFNLKNYEEESKNLNEEKKQNVNLRRKIEIQSLVLKKLQKYEQDEASNLRIIQLAISRNKMDQVIHMKEKIQKDCLLMKLESEIFKLELLMKSLKVQIDAECEKLVKLKNDLDSINSNFEDVLFNNSQLVKVWKHLVSLVHKRDEEYSKLKINLEKVEILYKEKVVELNSYKESGQKEMVRNEFLTADRDNKKTFLNLLERHHIEMTRQLEITEHELSDLGNMTECTEKNLKETLREQADYNRDLMLLENKLKKLTNEKYELEENIMSQLHNEIISNNATVKLNDDICKLRQTSLQLELQIKELNTNFFKTCSILEQNVKALDTNRSCLESEKIKIKEKEKEILKNEDELKNIELLIKNEENRLDHDSKELHKLSDQPDAVPELDSKESRVTEMLKCVADEIETKKQLWVQKQNEIMSMTERKTQLSFEFSRLHQHLHILRQKNSKLDLKLMKSNEETSKLDKIISHLLDYVSKLNNKCDIQKQYENALDSENCSIQNRIMEKLQEAENEVVVTVEEIDQLKSKKELLEKELLKVQREDLEWGKKVKLATEMKQEMLTEQSEKGDIGSMKTEIHRMEIRYAQLKRAQESLISNLETCVSKRDRIFDDVVLKDNKKTDAVKHQQKIMRHINVLKSKNCQLKEKLDSLKNEFSALCVEKEKLNVEMKSCETQLEIFQNEIKNLDEDIREFHLLKHKNLELLIRKQKFADFLTQIIAGKIKTAPTNALTTERDERDFLKHQYLRQDLLETMELVIKEYPMLRDDLIRITNILQSYCEF